MGERWSMVNADEEMNFIGYGRMNMGCDAMNGFLLKALYESRRDANASSDGTEWNGRERVG